jgi:uncharacterized protein YdeI (YjbR/CyaY-like superfamily)
MDDALDFKNKEEWRNWLAQNHDKVDHVWLIYYKKGSGKKGISLEESVEEAICFGWIDGRLRKYDDDRFVLRFSTRKAGSVWSKINKDRAEKLIKLGRMTSAGLAKIKEAQQSGQWNNAYTNKVKEKMPSDLKKALNKDKKAWSNFQKFANTYQNMYIIWINGAKTDETRKNRIAKVVEQSLLNKKLISLDTMPR